MRALAIISREWVWTVPNVITLSRLLIGLWGLNVFYWWYPDAWFMVLFGCIACTLDGVDGWAARALDQVSTSGKLLDPLVDKALVWNAVLIIGAWSVSSGDVVILVCVALCLPMIVVIAIYDYMTMSMRAIDEKMVTNIAAKEKTVALFCALGLFLLGICFGEAAAQTGAYALLLTQNLLVVLGALMLCYTLHKTAESVKTYFASVTDPRIRAWAGKRWVMFLVGVFSWS